MRETDARILIDRRLREAEWDIENKNQVSTEETSQNGRADYILKDSRGRAIAVIEAKRFAVDPASAKQQALSYAESINAGFIFLSNGEEIYFWDYKYRTEQKVATFSRNVILRKSKPSGLNKNHCQLFPFRKSITRAVSGVRPDHTRKKRCRLWIRPLREANAKCSWLWQQVLARPIQ